MDPQTTPFWYDLPEDRIAQRPVRPYDQARCLLLNRQDDSLSDRHFTDLPGIFSSRDILVFNASRVVPARLFAIKSDSDTPIEILVVEQQGSRATCMARPMRKLHAGDQLHVTSQQAIEVVGREGDRVILDFGTVAVLEHMLEVHGQMPIPPYIRKGKSDEQDRVDYQNPHGSDRGSIAAPTAGLHFTEALKARLVEQGCSIRNVTLHVGPASFLPVLRPGAQELHLPGTERLKNDPSLVQELLDERLSGRRVIAVGTTVVRALESMAAAFQQQSSIEATQLFITPGYSFRLIDGLVTNFHQPGTTHLLLVEAFAGRGLMERSYHHALTNGYRFLSYGDGMCIL